MREYETIRLERSDRVVWIILDRPESRNALNAQMAADVIAAARQCDEDQSVGALVVTGSDIAFAAGVDLIEAGAPGGTGGFTGEGLGVWREFADIRLPLIAAVSGYALGGGLELALMCDVIIASDNAVFGLPEIGLGAIPGMGGTQRLVRALGYHRAAELILTGRRWNGVEAERWGLASRVVPATELRAEAASIAERIANHSLPATRAAKVALRAAQETHLSEGLDKERDAFFGLRDSADLAEGIQAFREKRPPVFRHR